MLLMDSHSLIVLLLLLSWWCTLKLATDRVHMIELSLIEQDMIVSGLMEGSLLEGGVSPWDRFIFCRFLVVFLSWFC